MMADKRQVIVVDPFPVVLAGVRKILTNTHDLEVRHGAASLDEAAAILRTDMGPDAILVDDSFGPGAVAALLAVVREKGYEQPPVCVWGMEMSPPRVEQYQKAGATCLLSKTCQPLALVSVLRDAVAGKPYVDPAFVEGRGEA